MPNKPARGPLAPETLRQCINNPVSFSSTVLGWDPWDHQAELMRAGSRIKVVRGGRRAGKSEAAAGMMLWKAFAKPLTEGKPAHCLVTSGREEEAKRVLAVARSMALASHLFRDCMEDDFKTTLKFSNGSILEAAPKTDAALRGKGLDFVILDEAFQLGDSLWGAAEGCTIAIPTAQIWVLTTPGNGPLHFSNTYYAKGLDKANWDWVRSWHWPSSVSPIVSKRILKKIQEENDPWLFKREYLAEETDDTESVFPDSVLFAATAYGARPISPEESAGRRQQVPIWDGCSETIVSQPTAAGWLGVDPGGSRDPWSWTVICALDDRNAATTANPDGTGYNSKNVYFIAVSRQEYLTGPDTERQALDITISLCQSYHLGMVTAESSGLGYHWANGLWHRLTDAGIRGVQVHALPATNESKRRCASEVAGAFASGQLVIPELLDGYGTLVTELRSMGQSHTDAGNLRLGARQGHDDSVMSLLTCWRGVEPQAHRHDGGSIGTGKIGPGNGRNLTCELRSRGC
jgi:hypothetical protein